MRRMTLALLLILPATASLAVEPAIENETETRRAETAAMSSLSEDEMSGVSGAQGVLLELKLRNNTSSTSAPLNCDVVIGNPNPCRMGLEFAARSGIWLMLKEYFGTLHLKDIRMDVGFMPGSNTAYYNAARFKDVAGANLIPGANPLNLPSILFTYPATDAQGTYDDFLSYLNIGRAWLEYDIGATAGYNRDTTLDSALSIRLADSSGTDLIPDPDNPPDVKISNNSPAKMRFWGTAYVFGF